MMCILIFKNFHTKRFLTVPQKYILDEFSISYSYKQVWEILKQKLGFNYGKPFLKFQEQPENYKEDLKKKTQKIH